MTTLTVRSAIATDPGVQRLQNEDRVYADETRGIFLVIDGLGGHAAGELAAETALSTVTRELTAGSGTASDRVVHAITAANNEIFELAQQSPDCAGMACVLTVAVVEDDAVTVGHVGDSRLYLVWNGTMRKVTSDHSPVGELEDQGELSEHEAMNHPRRHEVFRDIGSQPRNEDTPDFIELKSFPLFPTAALLLCTDGLTDAVNAAEIAAIIDTYSGDPDAIARRLIKAANDRGGADNVSVVFVAGVEFIGAHAPSLVSVRSRHAITRMRSGGRWRRNISRFVWLIIGMALGASIWPAAERIAHWTWGR